MMVYICTKFHENILNGIRVMELTRKVNGRTDRQTDGRHDIIRPIFDGHIKINANSETATSKAAATSYNNDLLLRPLMYNIKGSLFLLTPSFLHTHDVDPTLGPHSYDVRDSLVEGCHLKYRILGVWRQLHEFAVNSKRKIP